MGEFFSQPINNPRERASMHVEEHGEELQGRCSMPRAIAENAGESQLWPGNCIPGDPKNNAVNEFRLKFYP